MTPEREKATLEEYDMAAEWCAERGLDGKMGCRLPENIGGDTARMIDDDPEAFAQRVRECAYRRAMEKTGHRN